jgi:hypothetical protein
MQDAPVAAGQKCRSGLAAPIGMLSSGGLPPAGRFFALKAGSIEFE